MGSIFLSIAAVVGPTVQFPLSRIASRWTASTMVLQVMTLCCLSSMCSIADLQDPAMAAVVVELTSGSRRLVTTQEVVFLTSQVNPTLLAQATAVKACVPPQIGLARQKMLL